ncbi:hypothetical protein LXA43DRAFT_499918 [Ganoderma leucocontextum]|nr:hypothetical protein LXA43DRAFT_499918 [Ganoderma leucocontextum]
MSSRSRPSLSSEPPFPQQSPLAARSRLRLRLRSAWRGRPRVEDGLLRRSRLRRHELPSLLPLFLACFVVLPSLSLCTSTREVGQGRVDPQQKATWTIQVWQGRARGIDTALSTLEDGEGRGGGAGDGKEGTEGNGDTLLGIEARPKPGRRSLSRRGRRSLRSRVCARIQRPSRNARRRHSALGPRVGCDSEGRDGGWARGLYGHRVIGTSSETLQYTCCVQAKSYYINAT